MSKQIELSSSFRAVKLQRHLARVPQEHTCETGWVDYLWPGRRHGMRARLKKVCQKEPCIRFALSLRDWGRVLRSRGLLRLDAIRKWQSVGYFVTGSVTFFYSVDKT